MKIAEEKLSPEELHSDGLRSQCPAGFCSALKMSVGYRPAVAHYLSPYKNCNGTKTCRTPAHHKTN